MQNIFFHKKKASYQKKSIKNKAYLVYDRVDWGRVSHMKKKTF